jgi:hypothetical protein
MEGLGAIVAVKKHVWEKGISNILKEDFTSVEECLNRFGKKTTMTVPVSRQ